MDFKKGGRKMKRSLFCFLIIAFLCLGTFSVGNNVLAQKKPVVLKAVCFLPKNDPLSAMTVEWVNRVNQMFPEELKIEYLGGPEIISSVEQVEALKKGIVDIDFNVGSYYAPHGAEFNAFQLTRISPLEQRKSGFYDFMVKAHEKIGVKYLGRWLHGGFYMYLKSPIKTVDEVKGKKLRTGPLYVFFLNKLGAAPVSIKPSDVYTSLERGLVEGFCWPILGARGLGWTEICKNVIDQSFYEGDGTILFNIKKWDGLPDSVKDKILKMMPDYETDMVKYYDDAIKKERDLLIKSGVKFIKLDPKDAEKYTNMAYDAWWDFMMTKVPDLVPQLKKMSGN
jgi:TRAP-type C4-dicarboxylate transport system substrate-binding protein